MFIGSGGVPLLALRVRGESARGVSGPGGGGGRLRAQTGESSSGIIPGMNHPNLRSAKDLARHEKRRKIAMNHESDSSLLQAEAGRLKPGLPRACWPIGLRKIFQQIMTKVLPTS